ncbi:MAG: GNAT family N-acetyltransferase [Beijerinckiaceae bacterium]|nr:GNAT family N-acetyltransferase [Beijerinckiaceae bacterium]
MSGHVEREPVAAEANVRPHVEFIGAGSIGGYREAWADLVSRTSEPNVFLEPAFMLPLLGHLRPRARPRFLLAWERPTTSMSNRLLGLIPLRLPKSGLSRLLLARALDHALTPLGAPLLDAERGVEAFEAMVSWLGGIRPRLTGLVLSNIPTAGVFWTSISVRSRFSVLDMHDRAVLHRDRLDAGFSSKKRKELARQRRRLSEIGRLECRSVTETVDVEREADRFLALECGGWKGRRGTALAVDLSLADFARTMMRDMAAERKCRVDSLLIDDRPIAMGVVLRSGAHAYFWKTAFDEAFAGLSPGVHLTLELTHLQKRDDTLVSTDSCAIADHPMIDRIWPDRMQVADVLIALRVRSDTKRGRDVIELEVVEWLELARRRLRLTSKAALRSVRKFRKRFRQKRNTATPSLQSTMENSLTCERSFAPRSVDSVEMKDR